jgi:hypothetical protein
VLTTWYLLYQYHACLSRLQHSPPCPPLTGDLVQLLGIFDESVGVLTVTAPVEILDEVGKASIAVQPVVYHMGNTTAEALTVAALSGASYAIRSISYIISYCGRTSDISAAVGARGDQFSRADINHQLIHIVTCLIACFMYPI